MYVVDLFCLNLHSFNIWSPYNGPVLIPFTNCLADWNYTRSLLMSTNFTTPGLFEIDSTPIMFVLFWVSTYLLVFQCCWLVLILSSLAASTICIIHMIWTQNICILICSKIMFGSYQTPWKPQNCYYPNIHHRVGSNLFAHMLFSCSFQTLVLLT